MSTRTMAVCHMATSCGCVSLSDGCSTIAVAPATKATQKSFMVTPSKRLPKVTCLSSARVSDLLPNGGSLVLITLGPASPDSNCPPRALLHVSHGGPASHGQSPPLSHCGRVQKSPASTWKIISIDIACMPSASMQA